MADSENTQRKFVKIIYSAKIEAEHTTFIEKFNLCNEIQNMDSFGGFLAVLVTTANSRNMRRH